MEGVTIVCGDSAVEMRGFADGAFDAIVTDPPYNAINRETQGLRSLDKGAADSLPVDIATLAPEMARITSGTIYVWCSQEQLSGWLLAFQAEGLSTRTGVWWKTNPSPMNGDRVWLSAIEVCAIARHGGAYFDRFCEPPVWKGPTASDVDWHPTPKPVWLMEELVTASVPEGGTVLDPFMGSGATGVACRRTGRVFTGIDLNGEYVEKSRTRIAQIDARQTDLFGREAA